MTQTLPEDFHLSEPPVRNRRVYAQHLRKRQGRFAKEQALPPTTALGARLRSLRVGSELNQSEMALRIGYPKSGSGRVSDWERGFILPTLPILYRYASSFGITVSELLDGVL
jgi:DNA-binding XRE family transcriptional regulator